MKNTDAPLSKLLAAWKVHPTTDPNFCSSVYRKIEYNTTSREGTSLRDYLRPHRAAWAAATLVLLLASTWTGHALADHKARKVRDAMVVAYLSDLDPRIVAESKP